MEKAIQAINVATTATGNKGNTQEKAAGNGETTPFSEVLSPAREQAVRPPVEERTGDTGGNPLPGEQSLPEGGAQHAASVEHDAISSLLNHADLEQVAQVVDVAQVEQIEVPEGAVPTAEPAANAVPAAALASIPVAPVEVPVVNGTDTRPAGERDTAVVTGARLPQPAMDPDEVASVVRDVVRNTVNRGETGAAVPSQPLPPTGNGSTGTVTDAVQVAVRAGIQQALAAQVAQDGLQQSLGGNRQAARLLNGIARANSSTDNTAVSYTPILNDIANISTTARVAIPVGEAGWGRAVGQQVVWHVSQNIHAASLRLNPQHLGPLEMQVQLEGDKATLAFASQHAAVREALESALPRLREMFAQSGLDIVDVNVSQENAPGRQEQQATAANKNSSDDDLLMASEQAISPESGSMEATGLVDYYI
ncbi:MAG: hypothetical protein HKP57_12240 [Halobacteria archaeon]|nr:hypothetical protein [Halobacteria archaeon]